MNKELLEFLFVLLTNRDINRSKNDSASLYGRDLFQIYNKRTMNAHKFSRRKLGFHNLQGCERKYW